MYFRLYHRRLGGHVHCRLFAGSTRGSGGKLGDLVFEVEEFEIFRDKAETFIEFLGEVPF